MDNKILELIVDLSLEGDKLEPATREAFQDLVDSFQASVRNLLHPETMAEKMDDNSDDRPVEWVKSEEKTFAEKFNQ